MHENVRLCVECNRHSWSCPVKRLRSSGAERARAAISGAPAGPSGLERECRAPQQSRVGSKLETSTRAMFFEQPGRAISSALAEPSEFERPCRAPPQSRAGSSGHFERPSGAERARCRKRRQVRCFRAGQAEPSGLDVGNVGRCGVREARPSRVKLGSVQAVPGPLRRFNIRYIFKSWIHILLFFVSFFDELGALRSCSASHPL